LNDLEELINSIGFGATNYWYRKNDHKKKKKSMEKIFVWRKNFERFAKKLEC